jgi:DNA-binding transcriptional ArsR family regulator
VQTYRGSRQLDALGDPSRRAIVAILSEGPAPVGVLAARLPISRPAVSQHLAVLKGAGLVRDRAEGTRRVYSLDGAGLDEIRAFLAAFWQADLHRFSLHVAAMTDPEAPASGSEGRA